MQARGKANRAIWRFDCYQGNYINQQRKVRRVFR